MNFNLQPTLKGDRVTLRPLKEEDRDALFSVASDPLIWEQHPQRNRYQRDVFDIFFDAAMASKGALLILDTITGDVIGNSRYYDLQPEKSVAIGYTFLSRRYWGGGYNKEIKKLMLEHAFCFVGKVVFYVSESNTRSIEALKKIGAVLAAKIQRTLADGTPDPAAIFEIIRPDS